MDDLDEAPINLAATRAYLRGVVRLARSPTVDPTCFRIWLLLVEARTRDGGPWVVPGPAAEQVGISELDLGRHLGHLEQQGLVERRQDAPRYHPVHPWDLDRVSGGEGDR